MPEGAWRAFSDAHPVAAADFHFTAGEALVTFYESTRGTRRRFCKLCGAPVLVKFDERSRSAQTDPGAARFFGIASATLDDDPGVRPDAHAFILDKAPWFTVTDDLPQYPARVPGQNQPHPRWPRGTCAPHQSAADRDP